MFNGETLFGFSTEKFNKNIYIGGIVSVVVSDLDCKENVRSILSQGK